MGTTGVTLGWWKMGRASGRWGIGQEEAHNNERRKYYIYSRINSIEETCVLLYEISWDPLTKDSVTSTQ